MNSNQSDEPTQPAPLEADLLNHLTDFAATLAPDPNFQHHLEAELRQAHISQFEPKSLSKHSLKGTSFLNFGLNRFYTRRTSLAACALLATAVTLLPILSSDRATGWLTALISSAVMPQASAQTVAQALEAGQITLTADAQDRNDTTGEVRAIGNAAFVYPAAQIRATANEIQYIPTSEQIILLGQVQIVQSGETLQGTRASCSLAAQQCRLVQE